MGIDFQIVSFATLGAGLGSASLATDASGGVVSEMRYYPYGETRSGDLPTDYRYTGQRFEADLGLYDYHARYYDPTLGRFISADTLVPNPGNPQSLNRYSYVQNNPLRYTDPSGHYIFQMEPDDAAFISPQGSLPARRALFGVNDLLNYRPPNRAIIGIDIYVSDAWGMVHFESDNDPYTPDYAYAPVAVGTIDLATGKSSTLSGHADQEWYLIGWRRGHYDKRYTEESWFKDKNNPYGPYQGLWGRACGDGNCWIHGTDGPYETESPVVNLGAVDPKDWNPNHRFITHGCVRFPNRAIRWLYDLSVDIVSSTPLKVEYMDRVVPSYLVPPKR